MAITYETVSKNVRHRLITFTDASPWNDIPLERAALSLAVDGALPPPIDWGALPGSDEGLAAYKSWLVLWKRWCDAPPSVFHELGEYLYSSWRRITFAPTNDEGELSASAMAAALAFVAGALRAANTPEAYRTESAHAEVLLALCTFVEPQIDVVQRTRPTPPETRGLIRYLTSALEGYDRLRRVATSQEEDALWVEFLSRARYRIPAEFVARWSRNPESAGRKSRIRTVRKTAQSRAILVTFASGEVREFGAETVLLNCEPLYRADDERDGERQFLAEGLQAYGSLREDEWLV